MLMAAVIPLALLAGWLCGGRFRNLSGISIRHAELIVLPFLFQLLLFPLWGGESFLSLYTGWLYPLSLIPLLVGLILNRHLPGLSLMVLGLALNTLAITVNGGYMPASPEAWQLAGKAPLDGTLHNSAISTDPRLLFLGDIFAIPSGLPLLSNVFSVGDVLIGLGGFGLIFLGMGKRKRTEA